MIFITLPAEKLQNFFGVFLQFHIGIDTKTAPKSALGKALHYLLEQWPYLVRYLEDGRLELSNNRAEPIQRILG